MKKVLFSWLLLVSFISVKAQENYTISKPESSLDDNILTIKYDITGCGNGEYVDIRLIVLSPKGDTIRPKSISGDMGRMISCGFGKKISWNLAKDNFKVDEDIEIMVVGEKSSLPVSSMITNPAKKLTRGNIIVSSLFIPGLGQKKAAGKSGFFIFSGLVYGAAGASAIYYIKGKDYYSRYQKTTGDIAEQNYQKSEKSYDMCHYMLYGAAGVWLTNIIWSAVIHIKENPSDKMKISFTTTNRNNLLLSARWTF